MTQTMIETSSSEDVLSADIQEEEGDVGGESLQGDSSESGDSVTEALPLDQVFGILKNQRRRYVLRYLYEADGQVSLSDVAEQIAAWENDKDIQQISSKERKRVYVGLYQCHLPKMDGVDVVSFNKPRGTIELGENAERLQKYLDTGEKASEAPKHVYPVMLSLVGALVLAAALLARPATAMPIVDIAVAGTIFAFLTYSVASLS